jgi:hypothetical protein
MTARRKNMQTWYDESPLGKAWIDRMKAHFVAINSNFDEPSNEVFESADNSWNRIYQRHLVFGDCG